MIAKLYDFAGGYSTDTPNELMEINELITGENLMYKGKMKSRPGWTNLSTDATINGGTIRGFCRAYINSTWYNVVALDDGSDVKFYYGDDGAYTVIQDADSVDYTISTGYSVEMVYFDNAVVAVNGQDNPVHISYSSGWLAQDLETYDTRERGDLDWYAGSFISTTYTDDTDDAQSDDEDDFPFLPTSTTSGFYVAGVVTFNKLALTSITAVGGSPSVTYKYYSGDGNWTALTLTDTPTWTSAGNKTIEWNIPLDADGNLDWVPYGDKPDTQIDPSGVSGGMLNRYIVKVEFSAHTGAGTLSKIAVSHTQYLTQLFAGEYPQNLAVHQDRLFLSVGQVFRFSPQNSLQDWRSVDIEYCNEGGRQIRCMVSAANYLAVFLEKAVYFYYVTTTANRTLRKAFDVGSSGNRSAGMVGGTLVTVTDSGIYAVSESGVGRVSKHISEDLSGWTMSSAVVREWNGDLLISFPDDSIILFSDPDSLRMLTDGEGRLSFWKWTGLAADMFIEETGAGDDGYLVISNGDRFVRNTSNGYDVAFDTTQTNFTTRLKTKYLSFGGPNRKKRYRRLKLDISGSGDYTLRLVSDNGNVTESETISSGSDTHYYGEVSVPWELDGYTFAIDLANSTANDVTIYGFSLDVEGRVF